MFCKNSTNINIISNFKKDLNSILDIKVLETINYSDSILLSNEFIILLLDSYNDYDLCLKEFSIIIKLRLKYNDSLKKIDELLVINSINDKYIYWNSTENINTFPCLVVIPCKSTPKKQSIQERVVYFFYVFESILEKCIIDKKEKVCILYDRNNFDKEKHFDNRLVNAFKELKELKNNKDMHFLKFISNFIDEIYVLGLNFFQRSMFKIYKTLSSNKKILNKIIMLSSHNNLFNYFRENQYQIEDKI